MRDSTQSYGQSANNAMLARPGTYAGLHGRTQFTANNSLFGFILTAPDWSDMKATGHVEVDFFGVQPSDATESTVYTMGTVRMRLFYLRLQTAARARAARGAVPRSVRLGRRRLLPEQRRVPGNRGAGLSPQPADPRRPGRIPLCCVTLDIAAAAVRPVQRDSEVPDVQAGLKLNVDGWRGISAQGFGQPDSQPLAIGVSGIWRRFAVAEFLPVPGEPKIAFGYGLAANAFVPIIRPRSRIDRRNALAVNAEVTIGTGLGDLYTGLTGGALFPTLPNPGGLMPAPIYRQNIDSGIVTFDADGNLKTDQLARAGRRAPVLPALRRRTHLGVGQLLPAQVDEHRQPDAREQPRRRLLLAGLLRRQRLRRGHARRPARHLVSIHAPGLRRPPVRRPPRVAATIAASWASGSSSSVPGPASCRAGGWRSRGRCSATRRSRA